MRIPALIIAGVVALAGCVGKPGREGAPEHALRLASWNIEHLAEHDGRGCRPRTERDYAALREHARALDADVIALQEIESKAAAERVFDPAMYTVLVEERAGERRGDCRGRPGLAINPQRTGFAIRKGLRFERQPDLTALQLGDPDLRSAVDVIVRPPGGEPIRLLSVHLKSGCNTGTGKDACPTLFRQVPVLERWIDARAAEGMRFAVLGDFNRRLALRGDLVWREWDDASPPAADLMLASGTRGARCHPRHRDFIDFIVLDRRAAAGLRSFEEVIYAGDALSDHCAVTALVDLR